jgi:Na+-driven multidrug efflux pump
MCAAVDCHTAQAVGMGNVQKVRRGLTVGLWMNIAALTPFVLLFTIFAEPLALIFFPDGYRGLALEYAVRFFEVYSIFLYVNMIGHLMHSYMRSIGRVTTVLWVTILGSFVRVVATLLLIPPMHMDGVYLGLVLSWAADGMLSVILYFSLYHKEEKLRKVIERRICK